MNCVSRFVPMMAFATVLMGCEAGPYGGPPMDPGVSPSVMAEHSTPMAAAARVSPVIHPGFHGGPTPRRGVVTAGDIDDGRNLKIFDRYQKRAASETGLPKINLQGAMEFRVHSYGYGMRLKPVAGVRVTLAMPGAPEASTRLSRDLSRVT